MNEEELLPLLKQLAEGVLKQKQVIEDLRGRVARLEHVISQGAANTKPPMFYTDAVATTAVPASVAKKTEIIS